MGVAKIHEYDGDIHRPKWIGHIVLATKNKDRLIDWYTKVFGTKIFLDDGPITFMSFDGEHHRFGIVEMKTAVPPDGRFRVGMMHLALSYGAYALRELLENWERLKALGIHPREAVNHGTTCSLYYIDPDGNEIELMSENFASAEEGNEWYARGFFDKNPFGKRLDLNELLTRLRAGESAKDLQYPARTDADWPPIGEEATHSLSNRYNAIRDVLDRNGWLKEGNDLEVDDTVYSAGAMEAFDMQTPDDVAALLTGRFNASPMKDDFENSVMFDFGDNGSVVVNGKGESLEIYSGKIDDPDVHVVVAFDDYKDLLAGKVEAVDLVMKNLLDIRGDMLIMLRMRAILRPEDEPIEEAA